MARSLKRITWGLLALTTAFSLLYRLGRQAFWLSLTITAGTALYHFGMRLLVGCAYDRLMRNRADYRRP